MPEMALGKFILCTHCLTFVGVALIFLVRFGNELAVLPSMDVSRHHERHPPEDDVLRQVVEGTKATESKPVITLTKRNAAKKNRNFVLCLMMLR